MFPMITYAVTARKEVSLKKTALSFHLANVGVLGYFWKGICTSKAYKSVTLSKNLLLQKFNDFLGHQLNSTANSAHLPQKLVQMGRIGSAF